MGNEKEEGWHRALQPICKYSIATVTTALLLTPSMVADAAMLNIDERFEVRSEQKIKGGHGVSNEDLLRQVRSAYHQSNGRAVEEQQDPTSSTEIVNHKPSESIPMWTINTVGNIVEVNRAMEDWLTLGSDQLIGQSMFSYASSAEDAMIKMDALEKLTKGESDSYAPRIESPRGTLQLDYTIIPVRNEKGEIIAGKCYMESAAYGSREASDDIETLKIDPSDLLNPERGIYVCDVQGRFLSISPLTELITGFSRKELMGMTWKDLVIGQTVDDSISYVSRVMHGENFRGVGEFRCKDGDTVYAETSMYPVVNQGKIVGFGGFFQDVTPQVKAEKVVRDNSEIDMELLNSICAPAHFFDTKFRIIHINDACQNMFGFGPEVLGKTPAEAGMYSSGQWTQIKAMWDLVMSGEEIRGYETIRYTTAGKLVEVSMSVFPIRDENDEVIAGAVISRDVSGLDDVMKEFQSQKSNSDHVIDPTTNELITEATITNALRLNMQEHDSNILELPGGMIVYLTPEGENYFHG